MRDVVRSYLQIASGLTEMTRQRVTEVARTLVERSGLDLDQVPDQAQALPQYVQQVAEELYETGKANRDLLVGVVRGEVDKALSRSKPWTKDLIRVEEEIARLKGRVTDLEHRLARASTPRPPRPQVVPVVAEPPVSPEDVPPPARKVAGRKPAKKVAPGRAAGPATDAPAPAPGAAPRKTARKVAGPSATSGTGTAAHTAKAGPAKRPARAKTPIDADEQP